MVNPIYATLPSAPIHRLKLKGQYAGQVLLDQKYLYWTVDQDKSHIFRYPLNGGETETVATSQYRDGELTTLRPIRTGDWLIFVDTPASAEAVTWVVRALNLTTKAEQVIVEEPGDPISWPGPSLAADGDWVVWTRTGHARSAACDETILAIRNLKTSEQRELDRSCTLDHYKWDIPYIISNTLIVEQDLPDNQGRGNNIYSFDLTSGQRTALTNDGHSSMPVASGNWLVWKDGPRYQNGLFNIIDNLQTGARQRLPAPSSEPLDPEIAGHWLYWRPSVFGSFYVYNLETNQMLTVATPGENETIGTVAVNQHMAAWLRDLDFKDAPPKDTVLEWRTLP
jgi:hypothetical protein